jgi:hypothetical protein
MFIVNRYRPISPFVLQRGGGRRSADISVDVPAAPLQNKRETTGWPALPINRARLRGFVSALAGFRSVVLWGFESVFFKLFHPRCGQ